MKILIIDDHKFTTDGFTAFFKNDPDFTAVYEANNGKDGLKMITQVKPDIIILDIEMPEMNGFEVLKEIRKKHPEQKALIISTHSSKTYCKIAEEEGADGFIPKRYGCTRAKEAVIDIVKHNQKPFIYFTKDKTLKDEETITPKQRKILKLLASGKQQDDIAIEAGMCKKSLSTALTILKRIFNAETIPQLIYNAQRIGYI
jgi:DNA-binding NarL/FixJ family response regulator